MDNPCFNCVERMFGCHSGCKKYNEWRQENIETRERIKSQKRKENDANTQVIKAIERSKKK